MLYKSLERFFSILLISLLLAIVLCCPASAAPNEETPATNAEDTIGWVEAKASVPDGFKGVIIISIENQDTLEEFDIECLPNQDGTYIGSKEVPAGPYLVTMSFVYQNYTYSVVADPEAFTVNPASGAVPISITVTTGGGEESDSVLVDMVEDMIQQGGNDESSSESEDPGKVQASSDAATDSPSEEVSTQDISAEANKDDITLRSLLTHIAVTLLGAIFFACLIFGACWLYFKYQENNR